MRRDWVAKALALTSAAKSYYDEMFELVVSAGHELVVGPDFVGTPKGPEMIADIKRLVPGASAVILGGAAFTEEVFQAADKLKVVSRTGVGYDAVDIEAARRRGIPVVIAAGSNHVTVAEYAFGLMLALTRRIVEHHSLVKSGGWRRLPSSDLEGKTLGIAGLGRIGKQLADRGLAFGMKVIALESAPDREFVESRGIELVDLETLCSEADHLSLHLPLSAETERMINAETLSLMKPTAYLVNTARGGLVDEAALIRALREGWLAGAGLDVFDPEPPIGSPLLQLPNVILAPHAAGVSSEAVERMAIMATENALAVLNGKWPRDIVVNGVYCDS